MAKRKNRRHVLHILRIASQILFLGLFVGLLVATVLGSPLVDHPWLAQVFLMTDPLILVGMTLAGAFSAALLAALGVVGLSLLFPRAYCGWICPLGTSMDIVDKVLFRRMKRNRSAAPHLRKIKYGLLAAVLVMAVFGLGVFGWFDPICIATRSFAVAVYPIVDWAAKAGLVAAEERGVGAAADLYDWASEAGLFIRDANFKEGSPGIAYLWLFTFAGVLLALWLSQAYQKRFWCRNLCPLGAMLGLVGSASPFRPRVSETCISCDACRQGCKMGAFQPAADGERYRNLTQECILCYACEREFCPVDAIHIGAGAPGPVRPAPGVLPGRRAALTAVAAGAVVAPAMLLDQRTREKNETNPKVRPPGSLRPDTEFLAACVRCGECMRVCPTNALHPSGIENGVAGLWTPTFVFNIGYCEYYCGVTAEDIESGRTDAVANLCGKVCPTGAIQPLTHAGKIDHKIGTAVFDHTRCLPWARGEECLTCEEQCPLPEKAISHRTEEVANLEWLHLPQADRHRYEKLETQRAAGTLSDAERQELDAMPPKSRRLARPYVLRDRCIGCGTCENVCPLDGRSGVRVERLQTRAIQ
jgi:polyferredoxin/NAD-dependent dihydropyrimidine dehydrogenase PreA subunit